MSNTKTFVLRIGQEQMAAVEKWAADEFRSTNGQLLWIIEQALKKHGRYNIPKEKPPGEEKA